MKFYRLNDNAVIPTFATEYSACFDLRASLIPSNVITAYSPDNQKLNISIETNSNHEGKLLIQPFFRYLIPTDLIVDIDIGYELKVYPRSGLALKSGLVLGNQTGVIDADYVDPLYIMLMNISTDCFIIYNKDRVAQAQLVSLVKSRNLLETLIKPQKKSSRNGGLGSTGISNEVGRNKVEF